MKLQYKNQQFQADAAQAVVDVFAGQPHMRQSYLRDSGMSLPAAFTGWNNHPVALPEASVLTNLNTVQLRHGLPPSDKLEGTYNLTIEMETGVGKTYTYTKTMYELYRAYGWCKFIIVVPSVAIREGVYKSLQMTEDHFAEEYGQRIRYFIYNSKDLNQLDSFAAGNGIHAMIINAQAFNARGKDARRIHMKLDAFRSRRPIEVVASTNPILIIDEPQSVEGKVTKEALKDFKPLLTLRYSATHRELFNMVYRLDAMDAYNQKLVKKIAVKGIRQVNDSATEGYVFLESVNLSRGNPTATIEFDKESGNGVKKSRRTVDVGFDLYAHSGELEEYRDGYTVSEIDGRDNSLTFVNGKRLCTGDVIGNVVEQDARRIQIRETILSHFERERVLFRAGIKVLSLFFIDEVANYRKYDNGQAIKGEYARMFEEEYEKLQQEQCNELGDTEWQEFLRGTQADKAHQGYFSIDKNKKTGEERIVNSKVERGSTESADVDAYDLIMKNKERLLDMREPVRFVFSHSALREGWDNPNVFQICTLKRSSSDIRKRQEVGRGMRLCVNSAGARMDAAELGESDVHTTNRLTVIASESYEEFAKGLQKELAEGITTRPKKVTPDLFKGGKAHNGRGEDITVDEDMATVINGALIAQGYVRNGSLTEKYHTARREGTFTLEGVDIQAADVIALLQRVYDPDLLVPDDDRNRNVRVSINAEQREAFQILWQQINHKTCYAVSFDTGELVNNCIAALDKSLKVAEIRFEVKSGEMDRIDSREALSAGAAFAEGKSEQCHLATAVNTTVRYDLIGEVVERTGLTRKAVADILRGIKPDVFEQFKRNPVDFILKASHIINEQKATLVVQGITYNKLEDCFDTDIFTEPGLRGALGINAVATTKHLYDYLVYDSAGERKLGEALENAEEVSVYAKLPKKFQIATPMGRYNPDWAIAFKDNKGIQYIYFVAETKGALDGLQLRAIEDAKIQCARKHFAAIGTDKLKYEMITDFKNLMDVAMGNAHIERRDT